MFLKEASISNLLHDLFTLFTSAILKEALFFSYRSWGLSLYKVVGFSVWSSYKKKIIKPHHLNYSVISKADSSILCREMEGQAAQAKVADFNSAKFGEDRGERSSKSFPQLPWGQACLLMPWTMFFFVFQGDTYPVDEGIILYLKQKLISRNQGI